jgi:hypothetical protein
MFIGVIKMYKLPKPFAIGIPITSVYQIESRLWIPFDPANTDYQDYLKWLAEGNTPEPADQGE